MDENIKREIIMEHYQNPLHRRKVEDASYDQANSRNVSCIDNIDVYAKIENNIIKDIAFDGEACAISISSTSIMIENLIGKTIEQGLEYINNFEKMVNEEPYDKEILKDALVYSDIHKQNSRKTCATLPYRGIKEILLKNQK